MRGRHQAFQAPHDDVPVGPQWAIGTG